MTRMMKTSDKVAFFDFMRTSDSEVKNALHAFATEPFFFLNRVLLTKTILLNDCLAKRASYSFSIEANCLQFRMPKMAFDIKRNQTEDEVFAEISPTACNSLK